MVVEFIIALLFLLTFPRVKLLRLFTLHVPVKWKISICLGCDTGYLRNMMSYLKLLNIPFLYSCLLIFRLWLNTEWWTNEIWLRLWTIFYFFCEDCWFFDKNTFLLRRYCTRLGKRAFFYTLLFVCRLFCFLFHVAFIFFLEHFN